MEYDTGSNSDEYYQAFLSGIGFHSAALPNELRTYVEKKFLESREMRIVCSTETLAYGVNSSVDVVIIADIYKSEGGTSRPLTLNEYKNYAGRAGRLHKDSKSFKRNGYVYTLVSKNRLAHWETLKEDRALEKLCSHFHINNDQYMPFSLLNLLPLNNDESMTIEDLMEIVHILPQDDSVKEDTLIEEINDAIRFLEQQQLTVCAGGRSVRRGQTPQNERKYCLTELGNRLRGYIISRDDYETLVRAVREYVNGLFLESGKTKFIFELLNTKHAETELNSFFYESESRVSSVQGN